jgi:hypothetical protein
MQWLLEVDASPTVGTATQICFCVLSVGDSLSCTYSISFHVIVIMLCFLKFSCTYFITSHVFVIMLYLVVPILSASMSFLLCYVSFHHASVLVQSTVCLSVQCIYCLCYYKCHVCSCMCAKGWQWLRIIGCRKNAISEGYSIINMFTCFPHSLLPGLLGSFCYPQHYAFELLHSFTSPFHGYLSHDMACSYDDV